ncbi:maleylpyruvate isomerase N-terminal domain-containing protein [Pedobacter sp. ASV28]|uniref:maleylpyruvate isomerase N-terminal domain-containing protein n=1 Tax=Pedobacter sp. ASV28 TaxID=2795123 RepID=UPI0018EB9A2D|nr:maleylpyruvate isomerase N-terminal domain-containing protein [Pedobacter sp. ASV28]
MTKLKHNNLPIETLHLFPVLDKQLIQLLSSLSDEEWDLPTVARLWTVKDIASHLLDGNLRGLSTSRDAYFGEKPENVNSYQDLVSFLNKLNMTWTNATKRLSPQILTFLLETTGKQYTEHLQSLNPFGDAIFSVAWAGQETSPNWFHIAREYTEKFLHQQQIREAVNQQAILTKELYYPFLDTLMLAFAPTFRQVSAQNGTTVSLEISTAIGGQWNITKMESGWVLNKDLDIDPNAKVIIDPHTAWKLFSKSWSSDQVMDKVEIKGDQSLGKQALKMVAVMA